MNCIRCQKPILRCDRRVHASCVWPVPEIVEQAIIELEKSATVALLGWQRFSIPPGDAMRHLQKAFRTFEERRAKWPR